MIRSVQGGLVVCFEDWTPAMMALAARLHDLPIRPGQEGKPVRLELGIDRLARFAGRYAQAINLLLDCSDQFVYCPNAEEVMVLGLRVVNMTLELERFQERRAQALFRSRCRLQRTAHIKLRRTT